MACPSRSLPTPGDPAGRRSSKVDRMPARRNPRHAQPVLTRFRVRLTVPRRGGMVEWLHATGEFERRLAGQQDLPVADAHIESESRRGRDFVAVRILLTVDAADVAQALTVAWDALQGAASDDLAGWDLASARAEVQPEGT
jgi:hypothetical protein